MKARITAIRLHVRADGRGFGATAHLGHGLNVLRASNSRGKSQFVQAVIYGLGMERMLSARANAPLGSVFTTEIAFADDGDVEQTAPVQESWVAVELQNEDGAHLTVQRYVRHPTIARNLVRVWRTAAVTTEELVGGEEQFLHESGSATRDRGFHRSLTDFLGWSLPRVSTLSGAETLLYPDAVFPFLLVDQQSWGSAAPRKVERFQIREPTKRAVEFLLSLQGPEARAQRESLESQLTEGRTQWQSIRRSLASAASSVGGRVVNVPELPAGATERKYKEVTSLEHAELELLLREEWVPASEALQALDDELAALTEQQQRPPAPRFDLANLEAQLQSLRADLKDGLAAAQLLEGEMTLGEAQLAALDRKVSSLAEERARNSDIRTLARLGALVEAEHLSDHNCPTCRQSLDGVEADSPGDALDLEDTIQLLNAQAATTSRMRERAAQSLQRTAASLAAIQRNADQLRVQIRGVEADLYGPGTEISRADVTRTVTIDLRRQELGRAVATVAGYFEELQAIAETVAGTRTMLQLLPTGEPEGDLQVLGRVATTMRAHLRASGFGSYDVAELKLDASAFRPTREGFDVDTDASASDVVRTKIAYLEAMREIGSVIGQHPGFLVLDEPRQQDIEEGDFGAILGYLATASAEDGGQVLVTSASSADDLYRLLEQTGVQTQLVDFGSGRILRPLGE